VKGEAEWEQQLGRIPDETDRDMFRKQWSEPRKYFEGPKKKVGEVESS
jgi:hypothetical protein